MNCKRQLDADVKTKWETGGLTIPDGKRIIAVVRDDDELDALQSGGSGPVAMDDGRDVVLQGELLQPREDDEDTRRARKRAIGSVIDDDI